MTTKKAPELAPIIRFPIARIVPLPADRLRGRQGEAPFDPEGAIDALHLAASRAVAHLEALRQEIERAPMPDADPERDPSALSRISILRNVLDAAAISATSVRVALSALAPLQGAVEALQLEAGATEALAMLLERELDRAPWDVSEGRIGLIGELATTAVSAARLIRAGLEGVLQRLISEG